MKAITYIMLIFAGQPQHQINHQPYYLYETEQACVIDAVALEVDQQNPWKATCIPGDGNGRLKSNEGR